MFMMGTKSAIGSYGIFGLIAGLAAVVRRRHAQRVAIRRRLDHLHRADRAAGASLVLDDHGLPERRTHLLGDDACHDVRRAAWCERHHQPHRLGRRKGLRPGNGGRRSEQQGGGGDEGSAVHECALLEG
jgi:hypothetical protein